MRTFMESEDILDHPSFFMSLLGGYNLGLAEKYMGWAKPEKIPENRHQTAVKTFLNVLERAAARGYKPATSRVGFFV